jgi:mRNA interferase RelE/StbE
MSWRVSYSRTAARAIRDLDPDVRRRVRAAIDRLIEDPTRGKPLRMTLRGLRSWRTGDWRIVYRATHETLEILVVAVGHRREVYDRVRDRLRP